MDSNDDRRTKKGMKRIGYWLQTWILVAGLCAGHGAVHARENVVLEVGAPYIELRTGPGRGFPAFHAIARGERFEIVGRETSWMQVTTARGVTGWVNRKVLEQAAVIDGAPPDLGTVSRDDFAARRFELGFATGEFVGADGDGEPVLAVFGGFGMTENLGLELEVIQALGRSVETEAWHVSLTHVPFPQWRVAPFWGVGFGQARNKPREIELDLDTGTKDTSSVVVGARWYAQDRFFVRLDYRFFNVLADADDNDNLSLEVWKLGVGVFF
jgi:hypothetical protein